MSFLMGRSLLFVVSLLVLVSARPAMGQQESISSDKYPCEEKYQGELAVFGRLTSPGDVPVEGANVVLTRKGGDARFARTNSQGQYCIRYSAGPDIASLWFGHRDSTCVQQISGNKSHYINKILDNNCVPLRSSATVLGSKETATILGSTLAKNVGVCQAAVSNMSGGMVQVASYQFEREVSAQGKVSSGSPEVITPLDPSIVELLAARQRSSVNLFSFGPVSLIRIALHPHAGDVEAFIRDHALRLNDIIPDGYTEQKLIFFDKSKISPDKWQTGGLGNLVIRANKLTRVAESAPSSTISIPGSLGSLGYSGTDLNSPGAITAVAEVK
jgi:hypothetical protein